YSWAKGNCWNNQFQTVFCLPLRNLNESFYPNIPGHVYTASSLLQREYHDLGFDFHILLEDKTFLKTSLLILEGYDELPKGEKEKNNAKHLLEAFDELKKKFPHILMTSRPGNVEFNHVAVFEVLGFSNDQ